MHCSKNGTLRHEMIGETQPEMELLEVVTVIYNFSVKAGSSIPFVCAVLKFSLKNPAVL